MPQGPLQVSAAVRPNGAGKSGAPMQLDAGGALITGKGLLATLNLTAGAHLIKGTPGRVAKISVLVAGAAGTLNDCATTGAVATANEIMAIPATVGLIDVDWPCAAGIVATVGAGQTIAISYE